MAFEFDKAQAVQRRYDQQAASFRLDAEREQRNADQARRAGNFAAEADHRNRAAFYTQQSDKCAALSRNMQRQITAAHAAESQPASETAAELERLRRDAAAQAEHLARAEAERAAAEAERQRQEMERRQAEADRAAKERERSQTETDRRFAEAERRGAELRRGRPGKEME